MRILIVLVLLLSACTKKIINFTGQLVNQQGVLLKNVEVSTSPQTDIVLSNKNGLFYITRSISPLGVINSIQPGTYHIIMKKSGYETLKFKVIAKEGSIWVGKKTMLPKPSPDPCCVNPNLRVHPDHDIGL